MKEADTVRRREKREEMQNTARGYRTKECPTGEEMNNSNKRLLRICETSRTRREEVLS